MRWPLGVVSVVYGDLPIEAAAALAREQGFDHIDISGDVLDDLALPIGDRYAPRPTAGCSTGPLAADRRSFEKTVADFHVVPNACIEPWVGGAVGSNESTLRILREVPGLKLLLDVGHVTAWGGDVIELLPHAHHIQLRQAKVGASQVIEGDVDFGAILNELDRIGYAGRLSVEYFDLPERGWPFEDPIGAALETAKQIRSLLGA